MSAFSKAGPGRVSRTYCGSTSHALGDEQGNSKCWKLGNLIQTYYFSVPALWCSKSSNFHDNSQISQAAFSCEFNGLVRLMLLGSINSLIYKIEELMAKGKDMLVQKEKPLSLQYSQQMPFRVWLGVRWYILLFFIAFPCQDISHKCKAPIMWAFSSSKLAVKCRNQVAWCNRTIKQMMTKATWQLDTF